MRSPSAATARAAPATYAMVAAGPPRASPTRWTVTPLVTSRAGWPGAGRVMTWTSTPSSASARASESVCVWIPPTEGGNKLVRIATPRIVHLTMRRPRPAANPRAPRWVPDQDASDAESGSSSASTARLASSPKEAAERLDTLRLDVQRRAAGLPGAVDQARKDMTLRKLLALFWWRKLRKRLRSWPAVYVLRNDVLNVLGSGYGGAARPAGERGARRRAARERRQAGPGGQGARPRKADVRPRGAREGDRDVARRERQCDGFRWDRDGRAGRVPDAGRARPSMARAPRAAPCPARLRRAP